MPSGGAQAPAPERGHLAWAALAISGLMVFLSFFVGWYSVDLTLHHWEFDDNSPDNNKGDPQAEILFDLEMKMLSIDTHARPQPFADLVEQRGEPNYNEHAGNVGTVLLGVLLLQATAFLTFLVLLGFYSRHRRRTQAPTLKRLSILFLALGLFTLLYFAASVGGAAQDDTQFLINEYRFVPGAQYDIPGIEVGFWRTWTSNPTLVQVQPGMYEVWEVTAESRPSAGWWLGVGSIVSFVAAIVLHLRTEGLPAEDEGSPESGPTG